ncbi:uncharacterized protein A1O5_04604 [Cladophialophora psammophila CBS 110553]|uniref:Uncharacterized protein n=1 Tax=Cladophialophora psammophila CBS 110553 TaxID=1182543 RepID=W9X471_9EURO|nr:uncharacterized protein A1O5_04604 [Cladophialophora psammophila CBS 110553]EXJ72100.1 hypothetical protein A1O5_04604 [Cladophialophora psammophila CBS 110553]
MKIARTLVHPIRSLTAVPFSGVRPSLRRQIRDFNRSHCHFSRIKPIEQSPNSGFVSSSRLPRKRRHLTPERFEKQYERLDHLVPLDNNHSKFLSDLAQPSLALEKDFDAIQEAEEAHRPFHEGGDQPQLALDDTMDIDDNDIIMADDEELEDTEMTDALQLPRLVYWQGECPPPEFFFPFISPQAGADILQQENNLDDDVSTTACSQGIPQPSTTPSAAISEPVTKDKLVDYFENLDCNIANGILPPNIAEAVDSAPAPAATVRDEQVSVEHAQSGNDVVPEEDEPEPEPEPLRRSVDPASFASSKLLQKPDSTNQVLPLYKVEPAASTKPKSAEPQLKRKVVSLKYVPKRYHSFLEEAMDFSTQQEKPPPEWWKTIALTDSEKEKGYETYVVRSFEQYAAWPPHLQIQPQFHCPDPRNPKGESNTAASCQLGQKRNKEERKRFSEIRKNHPNVWEAIIGTMLQEGVGIDNMLLCHEGQDEDGNTIDLRPQVLDNQKWCVDNWRLDNLSWHIMQDSPLPPDCSRQFHKAPKGDERLFHETIGYLKSHPEICYVFRILVSEWLKAEANQATFRRIARKAGWCPYAEHQLQREFIEWVFADADATPDEIFDLVERHFPTRYPRFFAATIEEEGIDYL